jgi:hypothetical protein
VVTSTPSKNLAFGNGRPNKILNFSRVVSSTKSQNQEKKYFTQKPVWVRNFDGTLLGLLSASDSFLKKIFICTVVLFSSIEQSQGALDTFIFDNLNV